MKRTLIILLHDNSTTADWVISHPQVEMQSIVMSGVLSQLTADVDDEVIAIIPGQDVLLTTAALEEDLLDEPEALHFATGPYQKDHPLAVAVIKKTVLEHWLGLLRQQQIQPNVLIPTTLALPCKENQWTITTINNMAHVRTGLYAGFSCEIANLALFLPAEQPSPIINDIAQPTLAVDLSNNPYINLLPTQHRLVPKNKRAWLLAGLAFLLWMALLTLSHWDYSSFIRPSSSPKPSLPGHHVARQIS